MKKLIAGLLFLSAISVNAQNDKYEAAMKKSFQMLDSAKTTEESQAASASFERIANAEKTQWLPYYYAALALSTPGWTDTKLDKDKNAEKIKLLCEKAEALTTDNADKAEILAIRNMTATQQMLVDPQSRWMSYGQEAGKYLQEAIKLNPANPRLVYLQGAGLFGTPEQFGGGKAKAKPVLEKAVELFKSEKPKPFYPRWGQKQAEDMLALCDE